MQQPAARRHAVRLVVETLRPEFVEIGRQSFLHELGMQLGDSIDGMASDDREVRHANARVLEDRDALLHREVARKAPLDFRDQPAVDLLNDLQMARQHPLDHLDRPSLQRFRQQGVIRVTAGLHRQRPGGLPRQRVLVDERAHQLRDRQRRMRVVEMDGHLRREFIEVVVALQVALHDVAHGARDQEVLLQQPQLAPEATRSDGYRIFEIASVLILCCTAAM